MEGPFLSLAEASDQRWGHATDLAIPSKIGTTLGCRSLMGVILSASVSVGVERWTGAQEAKRSLNFFCEMELRMRERAQFYH